MKTSEINQLEKAVLSILMSGFYSAEQIVNLLLDYQIFCPVETIYPVLSGLNLKNYLCSKWTGYESDQPVKLFFITYKGKQLI